MHRPQLKVVTLFSWVMCVATCVLLVWGFYYHETRGAARRPGAPGAFVSVTPELVHIRIAAGYELSAPLWAITAILAVIPPMVRDWKVARRAKLMGAGRCPECGFDLRASPNRCPECGASRNESTKKP